MSSLCCAIATQRLTAPCHAIAAQFSAFLLSSMPMHPKQNLAAANRYGAPLFLRKSHQRFSLPFLRLAALRHSFAFPVCASQCHCTAVHLIAFAKRRPASPCPAVAAPSVAFAHLLKSRQCRCNANHCCAAQSHRTANLTQPCHCQAVHRTVSANPGRQCHALALRLSPHMRCK